MENCNPEGVPILKNVNTQICEQLFKKVNSHRNCKSFNESRFFLFFLYQFDLHNLGIEGLDSKMADPREEFRWENIVIDDPDLNFVDQVDDLASEIESLQLKPTFSCKMCGAGYSKEGYLTSHIKSKHGIKEPETNGPLCNECGKVFANSRTLEKHVKTHLKCNTCKQVFATMEEAKHHKMEHTFCTVCKKEFYFVSKLTKHVSALHK